MAIVFVPAQLQSLTGGESRVEVEGRTVREVIDSLETRYPGLKARLCREDQLAPSLQVSIDSVMSTQGLRAKVGADSEVHFLPAIGGGC
jgi:molybdopterin synthase sulfur carrier subunit